MFLKLNYSIFFLLAFLSSTQLFAQKTGGYVVSGFVVEAGSREQLPGVNVYIAGTNTATVTNAYGFYSMNLPADSVQLVFSYVGFQKQVFALRPSKDMVLNVELVAGTQLKEVVVSAEKEMKQSESPQMSVIQIPVEQIKEIPALFGEKDVLKVIQLMPGVQKSGEGNAGIYVRGGGPDQNLIILDEAPVYNANHLFGFFSIFNGDALKSVELTKGGFPARYGGRLSSVIDMRMKEGNKEKIKGEGGVGLIASRFTLEGPIVKGKSSFLVSARRTYIDALVYPLEPAETKGGYFFYDLNAKLNYDLGQKNKLYLSGYFGSDKFYFKEKDVDYNMSGGLRWGNVTGTLRWNHVYNSKVFSNTSFIYSRYRFNVFVSEKDDGSKFDLDYFSGIKDWTLKHDYDLYLSKQHQLKAGLQTTYHIFTPKAFVIKDNSNTGIDVNSKEKQQALETGLYLEDNWHPIQRLRMNGGFRLSSFATNGRTYVRPEPRISASYMLSSNTSVKASFASMNQYIHLLSNTGIGLPTDLWVPTTANVVPQQSNQVAAGVTRDFEEKKFFISLEGYYKTMHHIIGYKEGASFLSSGDVVSDPQDTRANSWEQNVTQGKGWSYGSEILLQKKTGRLTGWVGYTLSWTQLQFDDLNQGKKYYARYDRRHDVSVVGIYKIKEHITFAATWVYGSGNAVSLPLSTYYVQPHMPNAILNLSGAQISDYGQKNGYRMAPYHRLDLAFRFTKKTSWGERTWEIGAYNAYSRANPFFYYSDYSFTKKAYVLKQVSLFPIIPSITYNFKF